MIVSVFTGLKERARAWAEDEAGSVTTDWVFLVAGIVTLSVIVMGAISPATEELADKVDVELSSREPGKL